MGYDYLDGRTIEKALAKAPRQYLTGHLERAQPYLEHIDDDIEIGITDYTEFTANEPHVHLVATDHMYIIRGCSKILVLTIETLVTKLLRDPFAMVVPTKTEEVILNEGDLFVLRPGTPHIIKGAPGTRVYFVKSPAGNDKHIITVPDSIRAWMSSWDAQCEGI